MPRPPPRSTRSTGRPAARSDAHEAAEQGERRFERAEVGQLAADVRADPDGTEAGERRRQRIGGGDAVERDAELVRRAPGRDLGVGPRVDAGVDPQHDGRRRPERGRHLRQRDQLGLALDVDLVDARRQRRRHLAAGLADAREDDPPRRHPGGEGAAHLALRHDIGPGPLGGERGDDAEVGVGLDRVGDQRRLAGRAGQSGERVAEHAEMADQRRRRIAIEGRPDRIGERGQVDVLGEQAAAAVGEMVHAAASAAAAG